MHAHHERHSACPARGHPRPGEVHAFEFEGGKEDPGLAVCNGYHALAVALHFVLMDVLPCPLVEMLAEVLVLVAHRSRVRPHRVAQTDRRSHVRGQVHRGIVPRTMYAWQRGMHFVKVMPIKLVDNVLRRQRLIQPQPYHLPGKGLLTRHRAPTPQRRMRVFRLGRSIVAIDSLLHMRQHIAHTPPNPNIVLRLHRSSLPIAASSSSSSSSSGDLLLLIQLRLDLRQPRLQRLHIPPLRPALPPHLIVGAIML